MAIIRTYNSKTGRYEVDRPKFIFTNAQAQVLASQVAKLSKRVATLEKTSHTH